jgi:hypothetical protein
MSDSNVNVTDDKAPPVEANVNQAAPVKWIIFCTVLSAIVVTAVNVFVIEHFLFDPGPFMVLWVAPALVCSVLLAVALTNLKTHQRRVSASLLATVLTVPISLILLYISILGLILYGLASSP